MTQSVSWRAIQRTNITTFSELVAFLELDEKALSCIDQNPRFELNLPKRLAQKIKKNDLEDPLFLQFVPLKKETEPAEGFELDPVQDALFQQTPKLLPKYESRSLVVTTSACAMHCRYCFRQNYDYDRQNTGFEKELEAIRQDPKIEEVILSGGDPLSLSDRALAEFLHELNRIEHVMRIRFHSRFLMGIPERIDESFLQILQKLSKQLLFVIHANHPNEFDNDVWHAIKKLQKLGVAVLNQSVLLKGVNDSFEVLRGLCQALVNHGVIPYYLHQLDKVQGTSHFEVAVEQGRALIDMLHNSIAGYAVPKYVQEIPAKPAKTIL